MLTLGSLANVTRPYKKRKLLGRGVGSKCGKTAARGQKGAGARSGYQTRQGYIGGGVPLHKRLPTRGFSNVRFATRLDVINLEQIEALYQEGEQVDLDSLRDKNFIKGASYGVKVLGRGMLTKKVTFAVEAFSEEAREKLKQAGMINEDV